MTISNDEELLALVYDARGKLAKLANELLKRIEVDKHEKRVQNLK